jgi:hypothetical protein
MMTNVAGQPLLVVADVSSLERTASGSLLCKVFFEMGDTAFPERDWYDFAVVLLSAWIKAALALKGGHVDETKLSFMDGPFCVELTADREGLWKVAMVTRGVDADEVNPMGYADPNILLRSMAAAAEGMVTACEARGWDSIDLENLRRSL